MTLALNCDDTDRAATTRFGTLITHGTFYNAGTLLSNASVVLPFICVGQGMAWLAALLYPVYCIGTAAGNLVAPYILDCASRHRHLVVAGSGLAMSALVALAAVVSMTGGDVTVTLLVTSVAMGFTSGVSNVASTDVASTALSDERRGDLLLGQGATGSVVATGITLLIVPMVAHDPVQKCVDLLLFGAAGLAIAGVSALFIGPAQSYPSTVRRMLWATLQEGVRAARSQPWFRRYALTQLAFVPVALGSTFYSLRAAQAHDRLTVVVVVCSLALVVGSRLWRAVYRAFGVRGMLTGSALMSSTAAAGCLVAESLGLRSSHWAIAAVLVLATFACQAVYTASISWVGSLADSQDRPALISLGAALVALATCVVGTAVGQIALVYSDRWPVVVMWVLSLVALAAARRTSSCAPETNTSNP